MFMDVMRVTCNLTHEYEELSAAIEDIAEDSRTREVALHTNKAHEYLLLAQVETAKALNVHKQNIIEQKVRYQMAGLLCKCKRGPILADDMPVCFDCMHDN